MDDLLFAWKFYVQEVNSSFQETISRKHLLTTYDSSDNKESACNAEDLGSIPGSAQPCGQGNSYPLQYSCLENLMDRGAWWATVRGVTKSQT